MKKIWTTAAALSVALAAGGAQAQLDGAKAGALMKKAACEACHSIDKKGVGPAYKDVAKKYKGNADAAAVLADKVRKGGVGNWGQIPMPPNAPDKIGDDDLKQLVAWILTQ